MQVVKGKGIVLIHGAGLGAFIWADMKLDWQVLRINFQNRGNGPSNRNLHFEDYLDEVIQQIENWTVDKMVIVGHSIGGCLAMKVAARYPGRVIGFIGLSAAIPLKGASYTSCLPFPKRWIVELMMHLSGTNPPKSMIEKELCHGLNKTQCEMITKRFTAESIRLYTDDCGAKTPKVKRLYIATTDDRAFPLSTQKKMAANLKAHDKIEIHTGHLPMLEEPEHLSKIINDFCRSLPEDDQKLKRE